MTIQRRAPLTSAPNISVATISRRLAKKTTSAHSPNVALRQESGRQPARRAPGKQVEDMPI